MESRAEVQSFDFRTLILVEEQFPTIPTYYLTGDPKLLSSPFVPAALRQPAPKTP
jgi:glycerophosphoryl diester phosphodiesterase